VMFDFTYTFVSVWESFHRAFSSSRRRETDARRSIISSLTKTIKCNNMSSLTEHRNFTRVVLT